jgi:altronate hydrolase
VATAVIALGEPVRKYGQIIGFATKDISPGEHLHVHNLEVRDFSRDYSFGSEVRPTEFVDAAARATFDGIVRADGRVGTRNYIGIVPTVNCSNTVARRIADAFAGDALAGFANVDGVVSLPHGLGCGMGTDGDGYANFSRTLAGYARHPNFAGVLFVGLGCEVMQIGLLLEGGGSEAGTMLRALNIQDTGGTASTIAAGIEQVTEMLAMANRIERRRQPASRLIVGLECGGSDAFSGITANPALGAAADLVVRHGGTAVLSETPEIYGAEHLLTRRAITREVGEKLVERILWWERYTATNGAEMNDNPTPGYDPVSITGMVVGGANMVCFTTGRGSVYGCKPVPCLKLATNSPMYRRLADDMDVNCGAIADGDVDVGEMGERIFRMILESASGKKTKSERLGLGDLEFTPWQIGAVM